jgi:hypothetical protein
MTDELAGYKLAQARQRHAVAVACGSRLTISVAATKIWAVLGTDPQYAWLLEPVGAPRFEPNAPAQRLNQARAAGSKGGRVTQAKRRS